MRDGRSAPVPWDRNIDSINRDRGLGGTDDLEYGMPEVAQGSREIPDMDCVAPIPGQVDVQSEEKNPHPALGDASCVIYTPRERRHRT